MNMNLVLAPTWIREVASKNGIKTGQFRIEANPSHDSARVFTPGKVRVWNSRKEITLTFGTDLNDETTVTDQNIWEMTR